jgi:hypothetical protein
MVLNHAQVLTYERNNLTWENQFFSLLIFGIVCKQPEEMLAVAQVIKVRACMRATVSIFSKGTLKVVSTSRLPLASIQCCLLFLIRGFHPKQKQNAKHQGKRHGHARKIVKLRQLFFCTFFMFWWGRSNAKRVAAFCARTNTDHMSAVSDRHVSFDS